MSQLTFQYKALTGEGVPTRGVLQADTRDDAYRRIVAAGLKPFAIHQKRGGLRWRRRRVSLKDISHFTYQFAVLMEARVPIADSLRSIADQESNYTLRQVVLDVAAKIEGGETITTALRPHRRIFGDIYVETLRAAESSGNMIEVLNHLAAMLDQQYEMRKQVRSALMYPICVVTALTIAVMFLVLFVVPKFAHMFESRGVELPFLTRALMTGAEVTKTYWYVHITAIGAAFVTLRAMLRHERWRWRIDFVLHKVPQLKSMLVGLAMSRFSHILGLSLRSGLGLLDALQMAGNAAGRPLLQSDAQKMRSQVNQGGRLTDVLLACDYIPGFARRMITAGEEAGELPRMCQIVARHYDREVGHLAKRVATIIEPVMIVSLAVVVLLIALSIFLPMWNMAAVIG